MLTVRFQRDGRKRLSSFFASGHAGWDEHGAGDVVCAAASALLQAAWLGLEEVAGFPVTVTRGKGKLAVKWPAAARSDPQARAILETTALAVEYIARQFPQNVRVAVERATGKKTRH